MAAWERSGSSLHGRPSRNAAWDRPAGEAVMPPLRFIGLLLVAVTTALPASAATFAELVQWCAPEEKGGRPGLCSGYLETYLEGLASPDPSLNDGVRACVPEATDRAQVRALIESHA